MNENHFFIIGTQRSSTTFLYTLLDLHPEVCMAKPLMPEPKFFLDSEKVKRGKKYYREHYFLDHNKKVFGEKSTSYIEFPETYERIQSFFPDAKYIVLLRNPVDRAVSNYFFSVKNNLETRTLNEVFIEKKSPPELEKVLSVSPFDYLKRGNYVEQLQPWVENCDKNNLLVIVQEKLVKNILPEFSRLCAFLNLSVDFDTDFSAEKVNASEEYSIPKEIRRVLGDYYTPYNRKLEELLGFQIPEWSVK